MKEEIVKLEKKFTRRRKQNVLTTVADLAPLGPLGYFCSRGPIHIVANRVATAIWGIVLGITFEQSRQLETVFPHRVYRDITNYD